MTTHDDIIARLRELEGRATPGPWDGSYRLRNVIATIGRDKMNGEPHGGARISSDGEPASFTADRALIVAMRNALPSLLAEVERLRSENATFRGWDLPARLDRAMAKALTGDIRETGAALRYMAEISDGPKVDVYQSKVEQLLAEVERLTVDNTHLHLANQGIHHYRGCSDGNHCTRCERDEANAHHTILEDAYLKLGAEMDEMKRGAWEKYDAIVAERDAKHARLVEASRVAILAMKYMRRDGDMEDEPGLLAALGALEKAVGDV